MTTGRLDDTFLSDVGLGDMPPADRAAFFASLHDELELRVGTRLSGGMSDAQLAEFESFIDRDLAAVTAWLDEHVPDFLDDPLYARMSGAMGGQAPLSEVVSEYASTKWLEVNSPNYRDLVHAELARLKDEVIANAHQIRAAYAGAAS